MPCGGFVGPIFIHDAWGGIETKTGIIGESIRGANSGIVDQSQSSGSEKLWNERQIEELAGCG